MVFGETLDESRSTRFGIAVDGLDRVPHCRESPSGGPEGVERGREVDQRPIAQLQSSTDGRLIAAVLDGTRRLVIYHRLWSLMRNE